MHGETATGNRHMQMATRHLSAYNQAPNKSLHVSTQLASLPACQLVCFGQAGIKVRTLISTRTCTVGRTAQDGLSVACQRPATRTLYGVMARTGTLPRYHKQRFASACVFFFKCLSASTK